MGQREHLVLQGVKASLTIVIPRFKARSDIVLLEAA